MFFYMSGTPRNDEHQALEDTLCTHRLFSMHGPYQVAVLKWLELLKKRLEAEPDTVYPKAIMLDSGAFTAWNAGKTTELFKVIDAYNKFMERADGIFDEIWMINLDVIPGERGRAPTHEEIVEALRVSDENLPQLVDVFGERILPVFHQGEPVERLYELAEQVNQSRYFCVSPRQGLHDSRRKDWAQRMHYYLKLRYPEWRTHGLSTTGVEMIKGIHWYSIDSAAWVLHAGFGKVDIFEGDQYRNYFVANEGGKQKTRRIHVGDVDLGDDATNMVPAKRKFIIDRIESYGFTYEDAATDSRVRSLICMGELRKYCEWASEHQKQRPQTAQQGLIEEF